MVDLAAVIAAMKERMVVVVIVTWTFWWNYVFPIQSNCFQSINHVNDEENFMIDIPKELKLWNLSPHIYVVTHYPDVSKIFPHGVKVQHIYPPKPLGV